MKIRPLFKKYQKQLLSFCNTEYGKWFISSFGHKAEGRIIKITPDGFHALKDFINDKPIIEAVFYSKSPFIKKFANILISLDILYSQKKIDYIPKYEKWNEFGFNNFYLSQTTFNPDADPEITSVDGYAGRSSTGTNWAGIRDGAGNYSNDTDSTNTRPIYLSETSDSFTILRRGFFLFDTHSLSLNAVKLSATLSFYHDTLAVSNNHSCSVTVVDTNPASNTAIVNADYANSGTTAQSSAKTFASWVLNQYNDMPLNSTGLENVSLTSISKFGLRIEYDRTNTDPKALGNGDNHITITMADAGSNVPKLIVTYTLKAGGAFLYNMI